MIQVIIWVAVFAILYLLKQQVDDNHFGPPSKPNAPEAVRSVTMAVVA